MCFKKNPIIFHNGSSYDYYFIIKELAEELKKPIHFFTINYWKIQTFTVTIKNKVTRIDKKGEEITIKYMLHIIYYCSLSNLVNNLSEELHRT